LQESTRIDPEHLRRTGSKVSRSLNNFYCSLCGLAGFSGVCCVWGLFSRDLRRDPDRQLRVQKELRRMKRRGRSGCVGSESPLVIFLGRMGV
jgi:hypothetical protein